MRNLVFAFKWLPLKVTHGVITFKSQLVFNINVFLTGCIGLTMTFQGTENEQSGYQ
jgi:hypothetical protein